MSPTEPPFRDDGSAHTRLSLTSRWWPGELRSTGRKRQRSTASGRAGGTATADHHDDDDDGSPGWDAIDAALAPLYAGIEPKHYASAVPSFLGGSDALQGISA